VYITAVKQLSAPLIVRAVDAIYRQTPQQAEVQLAKLVGVPAYVRTMCDEERLLKTNRKKRSARKRSSKNSG
jgi:hypothetical protein